MYVLGKSYVLITSGNQRVKLPVYFSPLWGLHRQCHLRLQSTITKLEIHLLCNKKNFEISCSLLWIYESHIFELWIKTWKYESDLRSYEHYLSSSENKAWKEVQAWTEYDFHIFTVVYSPLPDGFIWNQHNDQLPVGLLAQLVERCTGIAKAMGSNPV